MHPIRRRRRPWPTVLLLLATALLVALAAVVLIASPAGARPLGGLAGRVPGPPPLPWLTGAALLAMAAATATLRRRSGSFDPDDLPGGA
jgi:uncharacterized RDD family membrane protein YckC